MKGFYIYLSKNDSRNLYPDNNGAYFTVRLPERIKLERGKWSCGLIECCLKTNLRQFKTYYICTDIVTLQCVGSSSLPAIRVFNTQTIRLQQDLADLYTLTESETQAVLPVVPYIQTKNYEFQHIIYTPLRYNEFDTITIFLKEENQSIQVTTAEIVTCVIHFFPDS